MYEQICQNIIRPQREQYRIARLGDPEFRIKSKLSGHLLSIVREDDVIMNNYNQKIHLSYFHAQNLHSKPPCVIYLHANNGSRSQGMPYVRGLLEQEMSVALFDCTGSGMSDGDYVTLGLRESEDLGKVIEYLGSKKEVKDIALWGRSMGAVAALIYCSRNTRPIRACIYDSPFSTLRKLVKQLAKQKTGIPQIFFEMFMQGLDSELIRKANFCLEDLNVMKRLESIKVPGIFITSDFDIMVKSNHVQELFGEYKGEKYFERTNSQHHESRPKETVERCITFLRAKLTGDNQQRLSILKIGGVGVNQPQKVPNVLMDLQKRENSHERSSSLIHPSHKPKQPMQNSHPPSSSSNPSTTYTYPNKNQVPSNPPPALNNTINTSNPLTPPKDQDNTKAQNIDNQMNKRYKELSGSAESESTITPIMKFFREGCWDRVNDCTRRMRLDQEVQTSRGIDNWKTMVQNTQQNKGNKTQPAQEPAAKVSLKRALAGPSDPKTPVNPNQSFNSVNPNNRTQHHSLPAQSNLPPLSIPSTNTPSNSHPPTQRHAGQSQSSHKVYIQPNQGMQQRLPSSQHMGNPRPGNSQGMSTSLNQTAPRTAPRMIPTRR